MSTKEKKTETKEYLSSSVDSEEVAKFTAMADEWWDTEGKFKPLHQFNPVRIKYIQQICKKHFGLKDSMNSLDDLSFLDIGCGGGLLSDPIARMGASVTAIDASEKNIKIAKLHAENTNIDIDFKCETAEQLVTQGQQFDVVLNMEVIEHVADVEGFLKSSCALVKPGGLMFIATLNRTMKSYALAIIGAEYILGWLPRGTHNWKKFLQPAEINSITSQHGAELKEMSGVSFNPLTSSWKLSNDTSVNYMMVFEKK